MLSTKYPFKVERKLTFNHPTEILSPEKLPDRKAVSPGKVRGVNLPNKFEQSGRQGKKMNPER